MIDSVKLAMLYTAFAIIATFCNILAQDIFSYIYSGHFYIFISIVIGTGVGLVIKYVLDKKDLEAPIAANQRVGEISLYDGDKVVAHWPLVTLESVGKGGVFSRMSDYLHHAL